MEIGDHQPAMWVKLMSGFVKLEYEHHVKATLKSRIMHRTHETPFFPFQNMKEMIVKHSLARQQRENEYFLLCLACLSTPEQINTSGYITTIHHIVKNMLDRYIWKTFTDALSR